MQRSIRQLLESTGFRGQIIGFYFGMYVRPKSLKDGTYLTWYFNSHTNPRYKICFCNNLFECLLCAPHGMTIGYTLNKSTYVPNLLQNPQGNELHHIQCYTRAILKYTKDRLTNLKFNSFQANLLRQNTKKRIVRYMAHPNRDEVDILGSFLFCDDVTEAYHMRLASPEQIDILKEYSILARIKKRWSKNKGQGTPKLLWPFGTIAYLPNYQKYWYRLNLYIWEWLRYVLR